MASDRFPLVDGKPAWKIRPGGDAGFQVADHSNDFRLVQLPTGAVLSWVLRLTDASSESLILHRAFDLADPEACRYLEAVAQGGKLTLVVEGEGGFQTDLSVGSAKFSRLLSQGTAYNGRISSLNGADALQAFTDLFNPVFQKSGAEEAWRAVEKQIGLVSLSKPTIASSSSAGSSSAEVDSGTQMTRIHAKGKPDRREESEPDSGIVGGDFEPLLEAAGPDLYRRNAFRIAELPVNASDRDLDKRQRLIDMASRTGAALPPGPCRALPLGGAPRAEAIAEAMNRLRDPVQRLIDELFWFWPVQDGPPGGDAAIASLSENRVRPAFEAWKKMGLREGDAPVPTHNLAVLCHATALQLEDAEAAKALADVTPAEAGGYWDLAYRSWKMVMEKDAFWERLEERIREVNDPRLPAATSRRIRRTLPLALLTISARLAVEALEKGRAAGAEIHRRAMAQSGFDAALVDRALQAASGPLRDRLKVLCTEAEREHEEDGEKGREVAERLLKQAKPLLAEVDALFPEGNPTREAAHDDVALRAFLAIIQYGNLKEGTEEVVLRILLRIVETAEGEATRQKIESNIAIVQGNIRFQKENKVYLECWFCKKAPPDPACTATVTMYGEVQHIPEGGRTRVKWKQAALKVPRCARCGGVHARTNSWAGRLMAVGVVGTIIAALALFIGSKGWKDGGGAFLGLGCGGTIACLVVGAVFSGIGRLIGLMMSPRDVKGESSKNSYPTVLEAQGQGWGIGEKPPGVQ